MFIALLYMAQRPGTKQIGAEVLALKCGAGGEWRR